MEVRGLLSAASEADQLAENDEEILQTDDDVFGEAEEEDAYDTFISHIMDVESESGVTSDNEQNTNLFFGVQDESNKEDFLIQPHSKRKKRTVPRAIAPSGDKYPLRLTGRYFPRPNPFPSLGTNPKNSKPMLRLFKLNKSRQKPIRYTVKVPKL
ncbi:hypothetical protein J6590_015313 [Homalodisca vitripennis]|nr:hypothetical protein J6590_015313 [Homalodisca vitripennis]